jgi:hypothetical protein
MSRLTTYALAGLALGLALLAWAPWVPALSALVLEQAVVASVSGNDGYATSTSFSTERGRTVTCGHSRTGGCPPQVMRSFQSSGTQVNVWHDGQRVYQLSVGERVVVPYEQVQKGRSFIAALSLVLFVVVGVRGAMHAGFINTYARAA